MNYGPYPDRRIMARECIAAGALRDMVETALENGK